MVKKFLTARLMLALSLLVVGCHGVYAVDEGMKKTKSADHKKSDGPGWAFWRRSKPDADSTDKASKEACLKSGKDCKKGKKATWRERRRNRDRSVVASGEKSEVTESSQKSDINKKPHGRRGKGGWKKRRDSQGDSSSEKSDKKGGRRKSGRRGGRGHGSKEDKGSGRKSRWNEKNGKNSASSEKTTESKSESSAETAKE